MDLNLWIALGAALVGYLCGSISFARIITRLVSPETDIGEGVDVVRVQGQEAIEPLEGPRPVLAHHIYLTQLLNRCGIVRVCGYSLLQLRYPLLLRGQVFLQIGGLLSSKVVQVLPTSI